MNPIITKRCSPIEEAIYQDGFQAGAASRDAEVEQWLEKAIDHEVKHDVAVTTLEIVKKGRSVAQRALAEQCKHTKSIEQENDQLRAELATTLAACKLKDEALKATVLFQSGYMKKATEALAIQPDDAALESMITKAGEVMRERCARTCRARAANHPSSIREDEADSCAEAIHAIPGVTREDLKS